MSLKVIGLDIAKHVFQLHGADARGKAVLKKRLRREQLTRISSAAFRAARLPWKQRGAHTIGPG